MLLLLSTAFFVAGCDNDPSADLPQVSGSTSSPVGNVAPSSASGAATSDSTSSEVREDGLQIVTHEERLHDYAFLAGIDEPFPVEIVRTVSPEDWADARVACLQEAGWVASIDPASGGIRTEFHTSQEEAFAEADYICMAQYPHDIKYDQPYTKEQVQKIYDFMAGPARQRRMDKGVEVAELPSFDTVWGEYRSTEGFATLLALFPQTPGCPDFPDHSSLWE